MTPSIALEQALSSLDIRPGRAHRASLAPGESLQLGVGDATLVYVRSGELTGAPASGTSCTVGAAGPDAATGAGPRTLLAGDAFMSLGCRPITLTSQSGAELTVVPADVSLAAVTPLPPFVFIDGFVGLEPAAAALVAHLGVDVADGRSGDAVICRMMVKTVLLSAIRAWAARSAGASAWPAPTTDPFLSRAAEAVVAEPGRDWTIDQLASLSAMSRTVFAARFRRAYGRSPASYVTEVRMRHAKDLLESGASVSETSRTLGYGSDEGFSRAFRRFTGVAPSLWRVRDAAPSLR
ncbi:helix-turn-helix transcriptional regulator [Microbacterium sp. cf332]|uniref:helix-turn-helix transcriptional regulator n=1 Tax=Microbacterium sp. cf332 TaxID=1761804 RepID=UPI00088BE94A|nr:AraC family transcriptional regulator [Microbacterium sp. cf332]SDQ57525.1 AraC-type DNA-binding protein [Microbacterium sp. cf332]